MLPWVVFLSQHLTFLMKVKLENIKKKKFTPKLDNKNKRVGNCC
jgi:hypothetical protein